MKYILSFFGLVAVVCAFVFCGMPKTQEEQYFRLHITANSNSVADQNIKYNVKEAVVNYLNEQLACAQTSTLAKEIVLNDLDGIKMVVDQILSKNNANYTSKISITKEKYPTRSYADGVIEGGVYDSLKIDLGQALGDNWWCCVFPAVCII